MGITPRSVLYFVLTGTFWGLGFIFIRVAMTEGVSPVAFVFARAAIAAITLSAVMLMLRRRWPRGMLAWRRISILAVFGMAIPFLLYAWAGQRVPAGVSAIYNAVVPLSTLLLAVVVMRQERLSLKKLVGILLAGVGVVVILEPWQLGSVHFDVAGQIACILAVLLLGFAFAYTRKAITPLDLDPIGVAASQTIVTAVVTSVLLPFAGGATLLSASWPALFVLIAVGVTSTGFAYIFNFQVIEWWGAASASMVTYLTTLVGVVAGIIVLGEQLSLNQWLGAACVLLGVAVGVTPGRRVSR